MIEIRGLPHPLLPVKILRGEIRHFRQPLPIFYLSSIRHKNHCHHEPASLHIPSLISMHYHISLPVFASRLCKILARFDYKCKGVKPSPAYF